MIILYCIEVNDENIKHLLLQIKDIEDKIP